MTRQEQYEILGRIHTEKHEAERELALLKSKAKNFAEIFLQLSILLKEKPEDILFEGDAFQTVLGPMVERMFRVVDIDGHSLKELVSSIKAAAAKVREKNDELRSLNQA
jgi:hypothetical protein